MGSSLEVPKGSRQMIAAVILFDGVAVGSYADVAQYSGNNTVCLGCCSGVNTMSLGCSTVNSNHLADYGGRIRYFTSGT